MPKLGLMTSSIPYVNVCKIGNQIARYASYALICEVSLTPKPGLVDLHTNGAHTDMNASTFLLSTQALRPYFKAYTCLGLTCSKSLYLFDFVERLRKLGEEAEIQMLKATNGINTHKGANYSFSLILSATGMELAKGYRLPFSPIISTEILSRTAELGQVILKEDLKKLDVHADSTKKLSHGERLFIERGVTGIRGESAAGYPTLANVLLPYLRQRSGNDPEDTLLRATLMLMATLQDTNLLHRGGPEGLTWVQEQTQRLWDLDLQHDDLIKALTELDAEFTNRNLSPGGTADLLSLGIYFALLEGLFD